jgi:hypothetical protein
MSTVYVVNFNANYDYTDAARFGEVVYMSKGYLPDRSPEDMAKLFREYAVNSKPEDYLLLSGSNILCAIAVAEWMAKGPVNVLFMSTKNKKRQYETCVLGA